MAAKAVSRDWVARQLVTIEASRSVLTGESAAEQVIAEGLAKLETRHDFMC